MHSMPRLMLIALIAGGVAAWPSVAGAQLKGHYIPGFAGLGSGSQAPAGLTLFLPVYFYTTSTLKDDNGDDLGAQPSIGAAYFGPGVAWVTNLKLLGANLGGSALPLNFIKSRIEGPSLDVPGSFSFTDLFLQPVQLGWHKARADFVVSYGVFMPTGKWTLGGSDNSGMGMWSHDLQAGTTLRLDNRQAWTFSALMTYELHSHKENTDIKVGDILTVEGGLGKTFYKKVEGTPVPQISNLGLVYYGQFKVTGDSGPFGTNALADNKDQVFGVGLEGNIYLPKPRLLFGLRVEPEFGARTRTQGVTVVFTAAYAWKSFVKAEAAE